MSAVLTGYFVLGPQPGVWNGDKMAAAAGARTEGRLCGVRAREFGNEGAELPRILPEPHLQH